MKFTKLVCALAVTLLSWQCGLRISQEELQQTTQEALVAQQPNPGTDSLTTQEPILVGWMDSFQDATLSALVQEAQANNKNLAVAAANVKRALALSDQARAGLLPNVALNAQGAESGTDSNQTTNLNLGLQVNWEADLWGRLSSGTRSAQANAAAVQADLQFAQHSLAAGVANAYFSALDAGQKLAIAKETVSILSEVQRIVSLRESNGMAGRQDVALAASDLAKAEENLAAVEGARRDALRALELLLGRYPSAELEMGRTLPTLPPPPPSGISSEILERRPDLIAAERRVAAAFEATAQAKAARLPSLSLTGTLGGASSSLSDLLNPANLAWRLGTNLLAPLFDGGVRRANVVIATAAQEQALASYGAAALQAFSEVETALDQGVVLAQRRNSMATALTEAQEAFRIADLRYREGEADLLEVLTIQQRLNAAKTTLTTIDRLLLSQRVSLHLALGGSWN